MAKKTPEGKVKDQIKDLLEEHRAAALMPATHGYGESGHADFVACVHGWFFAIEAKAGKGKATALQRKRLREVQAAGGFACIVNETNLDALSDLLCQARAGRSIKSRVLLPKGHTLDEPDIDVDL